MLKITDDAIQELDRRYPAFRSTLESYESLRLPVCPQCRSEDTATVAAGIIGRSLAMATATTKLKLVPNGHPGDYYCWSCDHFFSTEPIDAEA